MADEAGSKMLRIAGVTAFLGPVLILGFDLIHIFGGYTFAWTIGLFLGLMLLIPPVIGLAYLAAKNGSGLGLIAGGFAFFGLVAGAGMQALFRVYAVLDEQGNAAVGTQLMQTFKLVASTQMIGLAWPIGQLLFAFASRKVFPGNFVVPLLFLIGAIAFPVGRVAGVAFSVILSGVVYIILFPTIGKRLFREADAA